jgi:flagellar motor switch protein FliG
MVLEKEHPQAIAVVLSELTSKKSSEVLGLLSETVRSGAVTRMTASEPINIEAKMRIAQMVCQRLEEASAAAASGGGVVNQTQSLRKVAVMLRNLTKEIRDGLLSSIREKDSEMGQNVAELMILWEDLPLVADRSLQTALREVDSQQLAKALIKAEDVFVQKIKANISERAAAAIEEETSLMSSPKKEDIESAREEIVNVLRGINEKGELNFVEQ